MSRRRWAERVVTWWVLLYTAALPRDPAAARRAEIASDLWEHRAVAGRGRGILLRAAAGFPSDISWRIAQGIFPPWLRPALRLAMASLACFILATLQHGSGRHTAIGNLTYGLYFAFALAAFAVAVRAVWKRLTM